MNSVADCSIHSATMHALRASCDLHCSAFAVVDSCHLISLVSSAVCAPSRSLGYFVVHASEVRSLSICFAYICDTCDVGVAYCS